MSCRQKLEGFRHYHCTAMNTVVMYVAVFVLHTELFTTIPLHFSKSTYENKCVLT
jgi:hypothetical protein